MMMIPLMIDGLKTFINAFSHDVNIYDKITHTIQGQNTS